jgi:hypothetical protein
MPEFCKTCKRDISDEAKYGTVGKEGWECKNCYFKPRKVTDTCFKGKKIRFKYN